MEKLSNEKLSALKATHRSELTKLVGRSVDEAVKIKKLRSHQGWWRAFVIAEPEGEYYSERSCKWEKVCNRTNEENAAPYHNFLNSNIVEAVKKAMDERKTFAAGIMEPIRLHHNLLSSQPLAFNFFGELMLDNKFALSVLQCWWPSLTEVTATKFEFAPEGHFDKSAFDVAFEVKEGNTAGLIGIECKYTDEFSYKPAKSNVYYGDLKSGNHDVYLETFMKHKDRFKLEYYDYVRNKKLNQLFRGELIAAKFLDKPEYKFVHTGLFCYDNDEDAKESGKALGNSTSGNQFLVILYRDFIANVQKLDLTWERREWTMLLWARYLGLQLSQQALS